MFVIYAEPKQCAQGNPHYVDDGTGTGRKETFKSEEEAKQYIETEFPNSQYWDYSVRSK